MHVEDHPIEYGTFEGEIPKGQYGAGTVEIWDNGTYDLVEEKKDGGLTVRLHGKRLKGTYALVPAHLSGDEKNWLIIRKKDESVPSPRPAGSYRPMLATPAENVPHGEWIYEIKWDGYRIVATVAGGEPELRTRKDQDYTKRFENVSKELVKALKTPDCVVDGEVCALDEEGRPSFSAMQQGKRGHADRLLRLRPARGRGRADRRPAARGAAQAAREAPRQAEPDRSVLGELRRRRRTVRSREPAGARGDPGQAPRLEVPPGQALTGVAEGQRARPAGVRDRRLHARQGQARAHARLARPGDLPGRRARIRRQRRHRLQRPRDRPAAREAEADRARQVCVPAKCRRCRA